MPRKVTAEKTAAGKTLTRRRKGAEKTCAKRGAAAASKKKTNKDGQDVRVALRTEKPGRKTGKKLTRRRGGAEKGVLSFQSSVLSN